LIAAGAETHLSDTSGGIVIQAEQNYFLNPFTDEPRTAQLLRIAGPGLAGGILHWQGKRNAFDNLRLGYFSSAKDEPGATFKEWRQLWGTPGEREAALFDTPKSAKGFTVDPPSWQHLALPAQVGMVTGAPPYGADLERLGIIKKMKR
jgi:hypothetical protein